MAELGRLYEEPYERAAPTRIPAGRLELSLGRLERLELDVAQGLARGSFAGGGELELFVSAVEGVALLELAGVTLEASRLELQAPAFAADPGVSSRGRLRYPSAVRHSGQGRAASSRPSPRTNATRSR